MHPQGGGKLNVHIAQLRAHVRLCARRKWVKGGCGRQADGTAGLPPAPEMPLRSGTYASCQTRTSLARCPFLYQAILPRPVAIAVASENLPESEPQRDGFRPTPRGSATTNEPLSVERDFCVFDHRTPFFYFELEQCGKFFRRRTRNYHTNLFEFCLNDRIAQCGYSIDVHFLND